MFQAACEHLGRPLGTLPGELQGTEVTLVCSPHSSGPGNGGSNSNNSYRPMVQAAFLGQE